MKPNTGKPFERLTAAVQRTMDRGSTVVWDETINGRQIDVAVRGAIGGARILVIVECRDYADVIGIDHVDGVDSVQRETNANKAILVTKTGFTSDALEKAHRLGIDTCTLGPAIDADYPEGEVRRLMLQIDLVKTHFSNLEVEFTDGVRRSICPVSQLEDDDGRAEFVDRIIDSWLAHTEEGRLHPLGKALHLELNPAPVLLEDDDRLRVRKLHCIPYQVRENAGQSLFEAPAEWVFRRILANGEKTEEQFFRFDELRVLAERAVQGKALP